MNTTMKNPSRRRFLQTSAAVGGGLTLAMYLPGGVKVAHADGESYSPNAWVRIAPDNTVTILVARSEMGQGVYTAMPQLVAEELDVDFSKIRIEAAPPAEVYINALLGGQLTGGSTSVRDAWEKLRIAGASARMMLEGAAAQKWGVAADQCKGSNGMVSGPDGKSASYGELAEAASKMAVPKDVPLKKPEQWKIVGKSVPRLDLPAKVNGSAEFGIDVTLPGMAYASVAMSPVIDGKVASFNADKAKAMPGVQAIVQYSRGVAVVADSFWQAKQARDALDITWDEGAKAGLNMDGIWSGLRASAKEPGVTYRKEGDAEAAIKGAAKVLDLEYETCFQSHSPMEAMNAVADVRADSATIIAPNQFQQLIPVVVAGVTGLKPEQVEVKTTYLGGGFGRRVEVDYTVDAAEISKAVGKPVKMVWTREDDMTHDSYRPATHNRVQAALDADGKLLAWKFAITGPSISSRLFPSIVKDGLDPFAVEAAENYPYDVPNILLTYRIHDTGVTPGYWRSVSHSLNCFVAESAMDEIARAVNKDPLEYRMSLLGKHPRYQRILAMAADKAGWGKSGGEGKAMGVAVMEGYGTYLAQISEVSVENGKPRVHRVINVIDCGMMVNPAIVRAQVESSVMYGLTAAIKGEITVDKGRIQQNNFDSYPMLRMNEMPKCETYLVQSSEKPGGVGEPVVGLIPPSVANALHTLTGKRIRKLPILSV